MAFDAHGCVFVCFCVIVVPSNIKQARAALLDTFDFCPSPLTIPFVRGAHAVQPATGAPLSRMSS